MLKYIIEMEAITSKPSTNLFEYKGLNDEEVRSSAESHGRNIATKRNKYSLLNSVMDAFSEPMFLLLLGCSIIYFVLGENSEALYMLVAIVLVSAISIYQETRNNSALEALASYVQSKAKLIRNNEIIQVNAEQIVLGDYVISAEGELIPADGTIVECNDFSINESILTGESGAVFKNAAHSNENKVFAGTFVASGQCVFVAESIGTQTEMAKIGAQVESIQAKKSILHLQINNFVKWMAIVGFIVFLAILIVDYLRTDNIIDSLLKGLTIAMSILPEEIPVAFSTFMALGAWRLLKMGVIVKNPQTSEALGSANVICMDKTGTITENKMQLQTVYLLKEDLLLENEAMQSAIANEIIAVAMWSSESVPFEAMEKSIHSVYEASVEIDQRPNFTKIQEYPLSGRPPMMTHVFENQDGTQIVACKGAAEALMKSSNLTQHQTQQLNNQISIMAQQGLRILAVGIDDKKYDVFPEDQASFKFRILGLVGFFDPPKKNIWHVFKQLKTAGINTKIITGDNTETTKAIARIAGMEQMDHFMTGDEVYALEGDDLQNAAQDTNVFTRIFPDAKLKIINSLIQAGNIVCMTGDGVNDAPALKAANIGIAMGKRGSELAKQAASLIIVDDKLERIIDAIALGRRIYQNLKKAIQYIISIHIPIILSVALPVVFGWKYQTLFTPIHVIFLELIMGPTCSIVFENEPMEENCMSQAPREINKTFFKWNEIVLSIIQGLLITVGLIFVYFYAIHSGLSENKTRTTVFATLVFANIFLTFVNRSFTNSVIYSFQRHNYLLYGISILTLMFLLYMVYTPVLGKFFGFVPLDSQWMIISIIISFVSVGWFEVYKWVKHKKV